MRAFPSDYEAALYTLKNPELVLGFDPSVPFTPSSNAQAVSNPSHLPVFPSFG